MAAEFFVARLALVPTHLAITIEPDIGGRGSPVAQHLHSVIAELRDARAYRQRHKVDVRRRPQHRRVATARWSNGIGDHSTPRGVQHADPVLAGLLRGARLDPGIDRRLLDPRGTAQVHHSPGQCRLVLYTG